MILMDKMKDHSCAIQPAFGYGGGAFNAGINFAMMFDQVFLNADNLAPDDEPDDLLDQPMFLQQMDGFYTTPANLPSPPLTGPAAAALQQSILATEQAFQGMNYPILQQAPLTVAEMVANAVHQHIATHHAAPAQPNNGPQPEISVSEMISNAIQEQLAAPPGSFGMFTSVAPLPITPFLPMFDQSMSPILPLHITPIAVPVGGLQQNTAASNQSQASATGLSGNVYQSLIAGIESPQQVAPEMSSYQQFIAHIHQIASHSSTSSSISDPLPDIIPPEEESNSSIPPFHAPVSSPAHPYYSSDFNPSDDEDYVPALVGSDIIIIDSAENSDNVDEN